MQLQSEVIWLTECLHSDSIAARRTVRFDVEKANLGCLHEVRSYLVLPIRKISQVHHGQPSIRSWLDRGHADACAGATVQRR